MMYFSRLKSATILAVCLLGVLLCLPNLLPAPADWMPWRQVRLGLDLRGGSYLLLQVDADAVLKERLDSIADGARTVLRGKVQGFSPPAEQAPQQRIDLRMPAGPQQDQAVQLLRGAASTGDNPADYNVSAEGNDVYLTLPAGALQARVSGAVSQSIEIVRRRIDSTGTIDPQIARQGEDRISVQLPGISDPQHVKELLGKTAKMTFQLLDDSASTTGTPPPGDEFLPLDGSPGTTLPVRRHVEVDGANLTDAQPAPDQEHPGKWLVNFTFDSTGARSFGTVTANNVGKPFAIVLDGRVISAPRIITPILGGRGQISGSFTAQSATDLATLLRAGALPAPLTVVEERSIGPELGADSIRAGAIALAVGFLLVIAYMATFYGLFGWFANVALLFNLVLQIAILSLLQATLTLPGMAGILLTLGVAVDANILINERIREEVRHGRTPLNALETGYRRAFGTIVDSNATAFLAHVMLFIFGSGPVRGFAVTITVGIVTTLFTATLVARLLTVRWYIRTKPSLLPV